MADKMPSLSEILVKSKNPSAAEVTKFHEHSDRDGSPKSQHHTLGPTANQSSPGNHSHDGGNSAKLDKLLEEITVTGSRGGNAALASLLTQLASKFGLTDNTTA